MLSEDVIRRLYPLASPVRRSAFLAAGPSLFVQYEMAPGSNRLDFFLAQIGHESLGLTVVSENLNYSADGLRRVWPKRFATDAVAEAYAHRPEFIANHVYGGRLGNIEPGDGYRYRGRGYIQLTGRDAYRKVGRLIGLPLEREPALARHTYHLLTVACGFWAWKNLNAACDSGDFTAVTRLINGGTVGMGERLAWLQRVRSVLAHPAPQGRTTTLPQPVVKQMAGGLGVKPASRPVPPPILPEPRGPQA